MARYAQPRQKEKLLLRSIQKAALGFGRFFGNWANLLALVLTPVCVSAFCPRAYPGVGVVLNESLHESLDRITGTGHTAVYFSNICPESPVKLRLCEPGESGSVMSTYINIGEDRPYGWNIVPLNVYLYGVEDPAHRPIFGSYPVKHLLEERYRQRYLSDFCSTPACADGSKAEWREMVAATLIRGVYIFAVDTTMEQDERFIAEFNASSNKANFNGFTRNCADFTRKVIDRYFPGAVHRDYINDFGMTSPKAVARTFTQYALKHPELNFRAYHFAQAPGTIRRSSEVRAGTEQLYRSKKWLVPMLIFADHELPFAAASYLLKGRFNPQHQFEQHAALGASEQNATAVSGQQPLVSIEERAAFVGRPSDWKQYHREFDAMRESNRNEFSEPELKHFFNNLDRTGTASIDGDGSLSVTISENGEPLRLGVSANNVLLSASNVRLSYEFLLARTRAELKSPKHSRETMQEFKEDWAKLTRVSAEVSSSSLSATAAIDENARASRSSAGKD